MSVCVKPEKLHILTFSHKLKSEKQSIFLEGAIIQKYSCYVNNFKSILSGYPKILNVWSIYLQCHSSQTSKQSKDFGGFVYVDIKYIPLKLQNEHTRHVSISYYFLLNTVCIKGTLMQIWKSFYMFQFK